MEAVMPSRGVEALGHTPRRLFDFSQFNHHAARVRYDGEDATGQQVFTLLRRGRGERTIFTLHNAINVLNVLLRPGDKGDLYVISQERQAAFKFIPDRKGARQF